MSMLLRHLLFLLGTILTAPASDLMPEERAWSDALGVCCGRVEHRGSFLWHGRIYTRSTLHVDQAFKGKSPQRISIIQRGGMVAGRGAERGCEPLLKDGEEHMVFLKSETGMGLSVMYGPGATRRVARRADGELTAEEFFQQRLLSRKSTLEKAVSDLTVYSADKGTPYKIAAYSGGSGAVTASGLVAGPDNIPARFIKPDRGMRISYLIDDTRRPTGLSRQQVTTAIQEALTAWTAVSSVTFVFGGYEGFGVDAESINNGDAKLRIQTGNQFGIISDGILGLGGRYWITGTNDISIQGGYGGQVNGLEFHRVSNGWVILNDTAPGMTSLSTFTEVLCHEIGHALGLAHSSENPAETNSLLKDAIMYFRAHGDGRGASLRSYDTEVMQKIHPLTNTPPWCETRYMIGLTGPTAPTAAGLNELTMIGFDRETPSTELTIINKVASPTGPGGSFARTNQMLKFTPAGNFSDSTIPNPGDGGYNARHLYRISDGKNCSPWEEIHVYAMRRDSQPVGGDGLPDSWMTSTFGNGAPVAGRKQGPHDDFDGDGLTNLAEYLLGTDARSASSHFDITGATFEKTTFTAKPWEYYLLESTTNFATWTALETIVPTTTQGIAQGFGSLTGSRGFLRLRRLP